MRENELDIIYLSRNQVLETYSKTIDYSGGGTKDAIHLEQLDGILEFVQNDMYYPTFEDKLTYLVFSINRNHLFSDGNKRLSITVGALFLLLNGYMSCVSRYMTEMENISYHLAAGRISKELLQKVISSILNGEADYEEGLKMEILEAISDGQVGFSDDDD